MVDAFLIRQNTGRGKLKPIWLLRPKNMLVLSKFILNPAVDMPSPNAISDRNIVFTGISGKKHKSRIFLIIRQKIRLFIGTTSICRWKLQVLVGYFSFCQLVWLNNALLLGSNAAVDALGVLNPEL